MSYKKLYIIDGYNVLRAGLKYSRFAGFAPTFMDWDDSAYNAARDALLNDAALIDGDVYIVYDGKCKQITSNKVKVVFTGANQTADAVIERIAYKKCSKAEKNHLNLQIFIVSNDLQIYFTTCKARISHMSAAAFCELVGIERQSAGYDETLNYSPKALATSNGFKLEDSIGTDNLIKLNELRDSLL